MTNLRENQKTKKLKLYGEVLVSSQKMFFLVFLEFFWFCLVGQNSSLSTEGFLRNLEKTKKPKLFGEVLVSGQKMFFLVFLEFFFGFRFLKTKKTLFFVF